MHGNVTEYTYYNDDRLREVIVKRPPAADRVFTYSYDAAGRLSEIVYPSSTGIKAVFDDGATPTPNSGWNENGQLTHLRYLKKDYLERPSEEVLRIRAFDELNTTLEAYLLQRLVTRPQP